MDQNHEPSWLTILNHDYQSQSWCNHSIDVHCCSCGKDRPTVDVLQSGIWRRQLFIGGLLVSRTRENMRCKKPLGGEIGALFKVFQDPGWLIPHNYGPWIPMVINQSGSVILVLCLSTLVLKSGTYRTHQYQSTGFLAEFDQLIMSLLDGSNSG